MHTAHLGLQACSLSFPWFGSIFGFSTLVCCGTFVAHKSTRGHCVSAKKKSSGGCLHTQGTAGMRVKEYITKG